jgi:Caspase domain
VSGQRNALIVANDTYEQEALRNLLAPGADAEALGRVLGDAQIGDFAVEVVRNEPSYVIEGQIEDLFSESRPDDVLLLHFSGHGLKSESGELFFAACNTKPNRLGSTAVSADFVQRCMRDARSRSIVLLLDCCYGGAFAQGVTVRASGDVNVLDSFPQGRSGGGRGRAVITASNAMEYAFEGARLADDQHQRPSVFTSALVEGLATGDADRDEDGLVSLNELYDYVFEKVREQNPHQTPSRQIELEGELYLARSRRRRIRPAPIPPDLQAAITDQNMYTRRGAVHELQSRLASEDLPVAAGAYEVLAELARTDIQFVADPAAAALRHAAVRPEETELHFGEQRQGSDPPHRRIRLLGPPISRACAPRSSDDWIRVTETAEGLDVSVDTTSTGTLRGSVDLKGPTGTAVIAIDVELLSPVAQTSPTEHQTRTASHGVIAPPIPADPPKTGSAPGVQRQDQQPSRPEATEQNGQDATTVGEPRAEEAGRHQGPTADSSAAAAAPQSVTAVAPSAAQPPIRKGVAHKGTVIALLGGITGIIAELLAHVGGFTVTLGEVAFQKGITYFLGIVIFVVLAVVAAIALVRIRSLVLAGFLQGMLWLVAPSLVASIVVLARPSLTGGRVLIVALLEFTSYALGVAAAILLRVSWSPAADRHRTPQVRGLPMILLGVAALSQVSSLIFYATLNGIYFGYIGSGYVGSYFFVLGIAGLLVVPVVTWYAMSLRARALGGALVLGWVTIAALVTCRWVTWAWGFSTTWDAGHVCALLSFVLLATVVMLTIIYMRRPSELEGAAN